MTLRDPRIKKLADDRDFAGLIDAIGTRSGFELEVRDALVGLAGEDVANALLEALEEREPPVASVVGQALAWRGDQRAVEPLLRLLTDFDLSTPAGRAWWDWGLVVDAVGVLKVRAAVDPLIAALPLVDPDMQEDIAATLGEIGDPRAVPALIAMLERESFPTNEWAADALRQIGGSEAERAVAEWEPRQQAWLDSL